MSAKRIDLNCDMGEGLAHADAAMLEIVSSANISTGTHAGSPERFAELAAMAAAQGIAVGIHPGFRDRDNFGRMRLPLSPDQVSELVTAEISVALSQPVIPSYVKVHGALANMAEEDDAIANAIASAVKDAQTPLALMGMAGLGQSRAATNHNIPFINEVFADRAYTDEGFLMPRTVDGAVLHDPKIITSRVIKMLEREAVITSNGQEIAAQIDTICVHGDTDGAIEIARALRTTLEDSGYVIAPKTWDAS